MLSSEGIQGSAKRRSPGLVNFVIALAYHFCLALPAAFMQPGDHLLADPCTVVVFSLSLPFATCSKLADLDRVASIGPSEGEMREGQRREMSIDTLGRRCVNASFRKGMGEILQEYPQVLLVDVGFRKPLGSGLILRPRMENLTDINVFSSVCAERERDQTIAIATRLSPLSKQVGPIFGGLFLTRSKSYAWVCPYRQICHKLVG